jgi:hypothetical protein
MIPPILDPNSGDLIEALALRMRASVFSFLGGCSFETALAMDDTDTLADLDVWRTIARALVTELADALKSTSKLN